MSLKTIFLAAAALVGVSASGAEAAVFSFADAVGSSTPLSITAGGNTATFSSPSGAGTFTVGDVTGLFSFSTGLGDFGSFSGDTLVITFATPVTQSILIAFGIEDLFGSSGSDTLTATTNTGQVVTAGTTLDSLALSEPEGSLYITPTSAITTLTLTSSNPFAIADVQVPEPMSFAMLGIGLAGLAALRRRRMS